MKQTAPNHRAPFRNVPMPLLALVLALTSSAMAANEGVLKTVMQINSPNLDVVVRGLENAQDISDEAQAEGNKIDLTLVVFGQATFFFASSGDAKLRKTFQKLAEHSDIHFLVGAGALKNLHMGTKDLLPGFKAVPSGAFEVLKLQRDGFLYIKP